MLKSLKFNFARFVVVLAGGALAMVMLTGCSQVKVTEYQQYTPVLKLEQFFTGTLTAHGVVKNRSGKVIRYFNADIEASWEDGIGTLDESFIFNDGERQKRVWTLTPKGENLYSAVAGDVTGEGDLRVSGNSLFMKYVLQVPYKDDEIEVSVDDRMYLVNDATLINESTMFKFGFRVGEVLLVISKQ